MISLSDAKLLLETATKLERTHADLGERRLAYIQELSKATGSAAGLWSWGRGEPLQSTIAPVAVLHFGIALEDWPQLTNLSLGNNMVVNFNQPVMKTLNGPSEACVTRQRVWSDEAWYASETGTGFNGLGLDHFLMFVRYISSDAWTNLALFKQNGYEDFSERDLSLISVALSATSWMTPSVTETISPAVFANLTARQRVVMLLLLEGLSRKQIASRLGLTSHTVNDHVKAIFSHFRVKSATQLASRFLQSVD